MESSVTSFQVGRRGRADQRGINVVCSLKCHCTTQRIRNRLRNHAGGKLDRLLSEYGLPVVGSVEQKRKFAMGAFLWPPLNR
ncbi:hypothetical protein DVH24_025093 [Malus domestica]|uniref:DUF7722 domain-containing protein n=1 Tax=Malus domestica TaxID=3750 RepID=A0A498KV40_MALDO|nr:hypothetical protein DVH24_025093 [Malus domestica]